MSNNQANINLCNRVNAAVNNKRGSLYVKWVCIILFLIILVAFLISFITAVDTAEGHRAFAKHTLDSYVEEHSIDIYKAVKQNDSQAGGKYDIYMEFNSTWQSGLVPSGGGKYYKRDSNGEPAYYVTAPKIKAEKEGSKQISVTLTYTLTVPVTFMGQNTVWVDIPMEIVSEFTPKF